MDSPKRASQACRTCRRLKRKCTKELPSCTLCVRLGKQCQYPPQRGPTDLEALDREALIATVRQLKRQVEETDHHRFDTQPVSQDSLSPSGLIHTNQLSATANDTPRMFPPAFFLDADLLSPITPAQLISSKIPPVEITELIGDDIQGLCGRYFSSCHTWFPFISKNRIRQRVDASVGAAMDENLALLLACMKLVSEPLDPTDAPEAVLYTRTKQLASTLEAAAAISLCLVQATVMIALYEMGHGIFPAAFLTVGRAARLGHLMGLHARSAARCTQLFKMPDAWTPREEERRAWWAILLLDRYIQLGPRGLPLATQDPSRGDLLPSADAGWDAGDIGPNEPLYASSFSLQAHVGAFARACQAAHVLGLVLRHRDDAPLQADRAARLAEALQLHAVLAALDGHLLSPPAADVADVADASPALAPGVLGLALCCSARLTLYNLYACNEVDAVERVPEESQMQAVSLQGTRSVVGERVSWIARALLRDQAAALSNGSPLLIQCLYHGASECQWFRKEGNWPEAGGILKEITDALAILAARWRVAGMYLDLLKLSQ